MVECLHFENAFSVWNKPAGMTVHNETPSLLDFIKRNRPDLKDPHFLNRLDKETSGLVVIVHSASAVNEFQKAWQSDACEKIYLGVHRPRRPPPFQSPEIWNQALSDRAEGRRNPQGLSKDRLACETRVELLSTEPFAVMTKMTLMTGRQHQIRRHSVLNGMELWGDQRYGDPKYQAKLRERYPGLRLGLHAWKLSISLEGCEQKTYSFEAPWSDQDALTRSFVQF